MGVILVPPPIHRQTFASIYSHAGGRWIAKRHSVPFYLLFAFGKKKWRKRVPPLSTIQVMGAIRLIITKALFHFWDWSFRLINPFYGPLKTFMSPFPSFRWAGRDQKFRVRRRIMGCRHLKKSLPFIICRKASVSVEVRWSASRYYSLAEFIGTDPIPAGEWGETKLCWMATTIGLCCCHSPEFWYNCTSDRDKVNGQRAIDG